MQSTLKLCYLVPFRALILKKITIYIFISNQYLKNCRILSLQCIEKLRNQRTENTTTGDAKDAGTLTSNNRDIENDYFKLLCYKAEAVSCHFIWLKQNRSY